MPKATKLNRILNPIQNLLDDLEKIYKAEGPESANFKLTLDKLHLEMEKLTNNFQIGNKFSTLRSKIGENGREVFFSVGSNAIEIENCRYLTTFFNDIHNVIDQFVKPANPMITLKDGSKHINWPDISSDIRINDLKVKFDDIDQAYLTQPNSVNSYLKVLDLHKELVKAANNLKNIFDKKGTGVFSFKDVYGRIVFYGTNLNACNYYNHIFMNIYKIVNYLKDNFQ